MDDFLEGDDAFSEPRRRAALPRRGRPPRDPDATPAEHRRQIMQRRLTAFGVGLLIIILLVLGVRGCLDARKTRAYENYANDLAALVTESNQLSKGFFERLENPEGASDLSLKAEVDADRGTAEGLLDRARSLDPPGEMSGAQSDVVLAFELRRDAFAEIGDQITTALGDKGSNAAIKEIADDMRFFLASDVLFERGRGEAIEVFTTQEIEATVPESEFLPNNPDYLDPTVVSTALAGISGETANVSGVHGMGLLSTSVDGVVLTPGTEATIAAATSHELTAEVQNQGESAEQDVEVTFTLSGGASGRETISSIEPQETQTVTLPISPTPPAGESVELTVEVTPVDGEKVTSNNSAEFTLIFG